MTNAKSLLASHDMELWHTTLRRYPEAIRLISLKKKKSELIELDLWLWNDYPEMVRSRTPESISKDELTRIMSWKLIRGKNRPTLLNLIRQNQESLILSVTTQALESLRRGNWNEALEKLTELRGVGPGGILLFLISFHVSHFLCYFSTTCSRKYSIYG